MLSGNSSHKEGLPLPIPTWRPGEISDTELEMLKHVLVKVNRQYLPWRGEVELGERDRLNFEIDIGELPLDIYSITLELERDEVTQGIPVEWNVLKANYKSSTREWQQRMQEEQYAGDCSVTLLYRGLPVPGFSANIQLQVTRLAEQHYEYMREMLKAQNEKVLYSHRGRTHELSMLAGAKSAAAVRYEIVATYYERMMKVLPDILDQPHRELRRLITRVPANTIKALNFDSLKLAARDGTSWTVIPNEPTQQELARELAMQQELARKPTSASQDLSGWQARLLKFQEQKEKRRPKPVDSATLKVLPNSVPLPQLEESFDNYENRFLKVTVKKLIALTKVVQQQLELEIRTARQEQNRSSRTRSQVLITRTKLNEQFVSVLVQMRARLEQKVTTSFLAPLGPLGPRRTSVVLRENRYYRQIRQIASEIEDDLDLVNSTIGLEQQNKNVRLSSINQLYEYWVTVIVLQTMVEKLGFTVVAKEGKPVNSPATKTRFNYILQSGGSMELVSPLGRRVMVYYDREYRNYQTQRNLGASYNNFGDEPEFEYENYLSEQQSGPNYYGYYEPPGSVGSTKRRPDIAIEVFGEGERVPKIIILDATYSKDRRTLYAKYEYRDSIRDFTKTDALSGTLARPVIAAWAIYPEDMRYLEHDEFRYGQLPLQPNLKASEQIIPILRQLLHIAGALE